MASEMDKSSEFNALKAKKVFQGGGSGLCQTLIALPGEEWELNFGYNQLSMSLHGHQNLSYVLDCTNL